MFTRMLSRSILSSPDGFLWYPEGDGGTVTPPPASGTTPPPASTTPPPSSSPASAGTPPPAPTTQFTYGEDRSRWVPPDVFKKAESLTNRTAAELAKLRADLTERDRRIAVLAGVTPPSPEEAEAEKVAAAFYSLPQFAHLRGVTPELLQRLTALAQQGETFTEARDSVWNGQADKFLRTMEQAFADEIGAQTLTPGQSRKLRAAFGAWIPDQRTDPDGHAAFDKRYNAGDENLIAEFLKEFVADLLEPARRQATIPFAQRRAVPRGGPSAPVVSQKQKPDLTKMTAQEMLDYAEKEAEALGR